MPFICKEKEREYQAEYYRKYKDEILAYQKRWYLNNKDRCKEYGAVYYQNNKPKYRILNAHSRKRLKKLVVENYGGSCECCGENAIEFLTIEHIGGWGYKHKKVTGKRVFYQWLKNNGFPKNGFAVLCSNCNMATRNGNECPHWQGKSEQPAYLERTIKKESA